MFDVIIVGGGPAGLSAALVLGRACRRVLLCDEGRPRNARARHLHGFLSRDGTPPLELLRLGREQLRAYPCVEFRQAAVTAGRRDGDRFEVTLADGSRLRCRKLVLATGVVDRLPDVEGLAGLYGRSVFHCPYCDGWEARGQPLAAYGRGKHGYALALELTGWSDDVVACSDGPAGLDAAERRRLERFGIPLREERVLRLEGTDQGVHVIFARGPALPRRALFFHTTWRQHSRMAEELGCELTKTGTVLTGDKERSCVPGLYVVGDASVEGGLAVIAAAEGAKAALDISTALLKEDLARREAGG